jgi:hypothetical protein
MPPLPPVLRYIAGVLLVVSLGAGPMSAPGFPQARGLHRVVGEADHAGLVGTEAGAATSTRAIADVVLAVRSGRPLR